MGNESKTAIRPWVGWQWEAADRVADAQHAIQQARPDIAVSCLTAALDILHRANCQEQTP